MDIDIEVDLSLVREMSNKEAEMSSVEEEVGVNMS